jgi:hypothetical protein
MLYYQVLIYLPLSPASLVFFERVSVRQGAGAIHKATGGAYGPLTDSGKLVGNYL